MPLVAMVAVAELQVPRTQRVVTVVLVVTLVPLARLLPATVAMVVRVVTPAGGQAPSVAMAGPLATVATAIWALVVSVETVALAAHRPAPIPWPAMAARAAMVRMAALAQPVPTVARVVPVVPVVVPRVALHLYCEHLAVTVVPVAPVVPPLLMGLVPVAKVALVVQGLTRLPLRL